MLAVLVITVAPALLLMLALPVTYRRGQARCDRRNAENKIAWEQWKALTPEDREWLRENGATEPSLTHWEMR